MFDQIEGIRDLLKDGQSGKLVEIPGGIEVAREFHRLAFRQKSTATPNYEYELKIPGSVRIPELSRLFRAEFVEPEMEKTQGQRVFVDAESIGPYVRIRNWKPGDYYRPVGLPAGKLKKLFQRARIPRSHRSSWPVVVADSTGALLVTKGAPEGVLACCPDVPERDRVDEGQPSRLRSSHASRAHRSIVVPVSVSVRTPDAERDRTNLPELRKIPGSSVAGFS